MKKTFGVIGGDRRQAVLAALLRAQQRVFASLLTDIVAGAGVMTVPEGERLQ